ncbi:LuxR C-terminal-related transcriptional regulator [Aridibaculum aurantiacum]|uniref:LuxR C-terminal-related transcriptional regulator n=1 Tax=Aridibaculum aurantiacum TaxID=2810307 RepID=UPI001A9788B6|nr:LuxR C-terminal-related transcriptional regulator [Aridibaculum aurantiacum]
MDLAIFNEADKIWKRLDYKGKEEELNFQLEVQKKLLQFFHVGEYYYYIFSVSKGCFEYISPEMENVLGYDPATMTIHQFLSLIHPDDQAHFLNFENETTEFLQSQPEDMVPHYKVRHDYRVKKKNGEYIRILQQIVTIQYNRKEGIARTFGVHTDISHLKQEGTPVLSFIGLNGAPSYIDVKPKEIYATQKLQLSKRERQILLMLVEGMNTAQISNILFISELTVKTHRKNLLRKTSSPNTATLVTNAIKKGWV